MIETKTSWVERVLMPIAEVLTRQRHLGAIQKAFIACLPFMMIGSFALILAEPPVDYTTLEPGTFLYGLFGGWAAFAGWAGSVLWGMFNTTLACLSLFVCVGITYYLSTHYKISVFIPIITAIAAFLILNSRLVGGGWVASFFEGPGLFAAILVGILATEFYRVLIQKRIGYIKMPDSVPEALSSSFGSLVPSAIIIFSAALLNVLLDSLFGLRLPELVARIIAPLVSVVDNVFGAGFAITLQQILWWFGIHDTAIGAVLGPIRIANFAANSSAYAAGVAPSELPYILTSPFWWVFCTIGGAGSTFGLAIVILLRARSKQLKTVGKLAIVPSLFNINEPILFGLPIVLNPLFLVPFIGASLANCTITYLCMQFGLVNKTFMEPGWNLLAPIGAIIATLDVRAVILVLFLIVLNTLIYYPFFKVYDSMLYKQEKDEGK